MRLIVQETLPLKEILPTLESRLLLHLLKRILPSLRIGLAGPAAHLVANSAIEVLVVVFQLGHLSLLAQVVLIVVVSLAVIALILTSLVATRVTRWAPIRQSINVSAQERGILLSLILVIVIRIMPVLPTVALAGVAVGKLLIVETRRAHDVALVAHWGWRVPH